MSFQVDLDELRTTITTLQDLEMTVESRLAELADVISGLQDTWSGEAAAAQRSAHARWVSGAHEMHVALGRLRVAADHAHQGYSAAADANASMWSQTR
ncbi:WXG100 family type VII secretion target [Nocardioides mangrovi]|uniref:ESAT-6-like protein n=1 Tax=Nocardioides mangrovi TaxID=2874580 RepID=A0ABS7UFM6_9ACTN|nr:WXG100 family type VII secretion target [Nocardioides mangrovi]MBZ5739801.1 WXG100 family type VII secretion target [Nocardioides mangrovi]